MASRKGRKRLTNVDRTATGQPSRSRKAKLARKRDTEQAATQVCLDARRRKYLNFPPELYADPRMASTLGRLSITHDLDAKAGIPPEARSGITRDQHDAAEKYFETRMRFLRAVGAPGLPRQPRSEDEPVKACGECGSEIPCEDCAARAQRTATVAWAGAIELLNSQTGWARVVRNLVLSDDFDPDDIATLRAALSALDEYFRKGERK